MALAQLTLYPAAAVERGRARPAAAGQGLQLIQALGLSEREVRYLLAHARDFDDVSLSELPTRAEDDTPTGGRDAASGSSCAWPATPALKRDLAGGTDDLIGVFEAAKNAGGAAMATRETGRGWTRRAGCWGRRRDGAAHGQDCGERAVQAARAL